MVVTVRVNTLDCLSMLDVLEVAGVKVEGMSFSAIVSLALSSLVSAARRGNIIPTPD